MRSIPFPSKVPAFPAADPVKKANHANVASGYIRVEYHAPMVCGYLE